MGFSQSSSNLTVFRHLYVTVETTFLQTRKDKVGGNWGHMYQLRKSQIYVMEGE